MSGSVMSKAEWGVCCKYLSSACGGRLMTEEQAGVYYVELKEFSADVVMTACRRAIQEQTDNWFPSIGVIRKFVNEAVNGALPQYGAEWANVQTAVKKWGWPRPVEGLASLTPLARLAVDAIGGWDVCCNNNTPTILSAQFRTAYEAAAGRESTMRRLSQELRPVVTAGTLNATRLDAEPQSMKDILGSMSGHQALAQFTK